MVFTADAHRVVHRGRAEQVAHLGVSVVDIGAGVYEHRHPIDVELHTERVSMAVSRKWPKPQRAVVDR